MRGWHRSGRPRSGARKLCFLSSVGSCITANYFFFIVFNAISGSSRIELKLAQTSVGVKIAIDKQSIKVGRDRHQLLDLAFVKLCKLLVHRPRKVQHQRIRVKEGTISRGRQRLRNPPCRLNSLQLDVGWIHGLSDELGRYCLSLCPNDGAFLVLQCLFNEEFGTLGILLCGLLGLCRRVELVRECQVHLSHRLCAFPYN